MKTRFHKFLFWHFHRYFRACPCPLPPPSLLHPHHVPLHHLLLLHLLLLQRQNQGHIQEQDTVMFLFKNLKIIDKMMPITLWPHSRIFWCYLKSQNSILIVIVEMMTIVVDIMLRLISACHWYHIALWSCLKTRKTEISWTGGKNRAMWPETPAKSGLWMLVFFMVTHHHNHHLQRFYVGNLYSWLKALNVI